MRLVTSFLTFVHFWAIISTVAFAQQLPTHRGPLKSGEIRAIVKHQRLTTVRGFRAAAQRFKRAIAQGRTYDGRKYDVVYHNGYGQPAVVPKGCTAEAVNDGRTSYALVDTGNVQVELQRQEWGKSGPTKLSIRFNPGQTLNATSGLKAIPVIEHRTTEANSTTPEARSTLRSYDGARWGFTWVYENDGWGKRNGKHVGMLSKDRHYYPAAD